MIPTWILLVAMAMMFLMGYAIGRIIEIHKNETEPFENPVEEENRRLKKQIASLHKKVNEQTNVISYLRMYSKHIKDDEENTHKRNGGGKKDKLTS